MNYIEETIRPSVDLRNHYNEISRMCNDDREAVIITVNGKGDTVSISYDEYKRLKTKIELLELLGEAEDEVSEKRRTMISELDKKMIKTVNTDDVFIVGWTVR